MIRPNEVEIVVPSKEWARELFMDHELENDYQIEMYSQVLGQIAELYREDFPWRVRVLGVDS
jgi:hypothetical protein